MGQTVFISKNILFAKRAREFPSGEQTPTFWGVKLHFAEFSPWTFSFFAEIRISDIFHSGTFGESFGKVPWSEFGTVLTVGTSSKLWFHPQNRFEIPTNGEARMDP